MLDRLRVTVVLTGDEELTGEPLSVARAELIDAAKARGRRDRLREWRRRSGERGHRAARHHRLAAAGRGKPAHSSQIFREDIGSGAIYEAARILNGFRETLAGEPHLTFNPGVMVGGTAVDLDPALSRGTAAGKDNVIAEQAVDRRPAHAPPEQLGARKERMQKIVAASLPHAESTLTFDEGYPPLAPTPATSGCSRSTIRPAATSAPGR